MTGIGAINAVIQEIKAEGINYVAGEQVGEQFAKVVKYASLKLRDKYPNLTEQQSTALVSTTVAAGFIFKDGSTAIRNMSSIIAGNVKKSLAPQLQAAGGSGLLHTVDDSIIPKTEQTFLYEGKKVREGNKNNVPTNYQIEKWEVKPTSIKLSEEVYESSQFGKIYKDSTQKAGNKEIWYSKDNAGHGGSKYKIFIEDGKQFKWIGNTDEFGNIIQNKHKGPKGKNININNLRKVK